MASQSEQRLLSASDKDFDVQSYLRELLDIAARRKWLILCFVLLSVSIAGVYAWFKPDLYRSTTVILVEHQKIPEDYVNSVVGDNVAERVSTITQQVLSRTSLQRIIDEFNLYSESVKSYGYDKVIVQMRDAVKLETKGSGGRLEAFSISFTHGDPVTAMKVAAKLASQYIDENLRIREQFVEGASEFLEQELQNAKKELDSKERLLSEFKLKYMGELPGQLESNLRALDRLQQEKASLQESLNSLSVRLELLQKSIHDYKSMSYALAELPMGQGPSPLTSPALDPSERRVQELENELARLTVEYTDSYPDVIVLKNQIQRIKEGMVNKQPLADDVKEDSETEESSDNSSSSAPVFDPYLQDLLNTRDDLKVQIVGLKDRQNRVVREMANHQGRIERTPTREQQLLILERDYANMQESYQVLHEKRLNSKISENLEKRQKGERFRILDPANLPREPEGLPRFLIVLAGLAIGCALGYGTAFGLEQWSPTFRRSEDVEVSIGFPILATIPSFQLAYGKSFKSIAHESMNQHGNGHQPNTHLKSGYLNSNMVTKSNKGKMGRRPNECPSELSLVSKWRPGSIVAEQYRVAATRLSLMRNGSSGTVVLVTSAMKGEGKTSTAANLAYTLARDLEEPTLIIDCDFKRPALHEVMSFPNEPGLADYLNGEESLEACLHNLEGSPLWLLPVGNVAENTVTLSKMPQISSVIQMVQTRFRYILIDAPPIIPLADINILAGLAEIMLLVVRSGITPKDLVLRATDMLKPTIQSRIVLTDAWSEGMPYYVRQGYEVPYAIGQR